MGAKGNGPAAAGRPGGQAPKVAQAQGAPAPMPKTVPVQGPPAQAAPTHRPPVSPRPVITGTAAPKAPTAPTAPAGDASRGVDAPTSHISRKKVQTTGMSDLSAIVHPTTPAAETAREGVDSRSRPAVSVGSRRGRGPLRASMQLRSIDPWSMLKISLLLAVSLFFVWLVAVGIVYLVLDGMGVWERLNAGVTEIMDNSDSAAVLIGPGQVFGVAAIIGIINVVLFTAMATIGAFIYNMSADAVGGIEVTLADRD